MPWITIIMAIISFLTAKKSGASNGQAAAVAGVAGLGTYYVTHNTEWGVENLGSLDGVDTTSPTTTSTSTPNADGTTSTTTKTADGAAVTTTASGVKVPTVTAESSGATALLGQIGETISKNAPALAAGAAVGAVASGTDWTKIAMYAIGGLLLYKAFIS